jgi:hypothetical protein
MGSSLPHISTYGGGNQSERLQKYFFGGVKKRDFGKAAEGL